MGRDDSTRKCSAVVSRLTDRKPRDRQNATVWRHSSKLNPSAYICAWDGGEVMIREY